MADCIALYYDNFKDKLKFQRELKSEMIRKFGQNKPNDWKYTIKTLDNCVMAEHRSLITHF